MRNRRLSRRTFLRGAGGIAIGLPFLEIMTEKSARAENIPKRLIILHLPAGVNSALWKPASTGALTLSSTLAPLQNVKSKVLVLSGLNTRENSGGGGDHGFANATYLTMAASLANGSVRAATSMDQLIAQQIGGGTKLRSLILGMDDANIGGNDSWGTTVYQQNISYISPTQAAPKERNVANAFTSIFGSGAVTSPVGSPPPSSNATAREELYRKSVLDAVLGEASDLRRKLGKGDQEKLDEYLNSVRELELKVSAAPPPTPAANACIVPAKPTNTNSSGGGQGYQTKVKAMMDLIAMAAICDATRVTTFTFADDNSAITFDFVGARSYHHGISHYTGDQGDGNISRADRMKMCADTNRYCVQQLAYLLEKLNSVQEGNGTVLDNSIIVFGAAMSDADGNNHSKKGVPTLIAGGSSFITGNRHVDYGSQPLANLWLYIMQKFGLSQSFFGNSTGPLGNIVG